MSNVQVKVETVNDGRIPTYATPNDAGADAYANVAVTVGPGGRVSVPLGIKVELPVGYEIQVRSKSGLSLNNGIVVLNSPGTIDSGYRGEVCAIIHNTGTKSYDILRHQKICQLVLARALQLDLIQVKSIDMNTERGTGGFGSTGI